MAVAVGFMGVEAAAFTEAAAGSMGAEEEEEDTVSPDPLQVCCPLGLSRA